jgi:hypothetical protein
MFGDGRPIPAGHAAGNGHDATVITGSIQIIVMSSGCGPKNKIRRYA